MRTLLHTTALLLLTAAGGFLYAQEQSITGKVSSAQGEVLSFASVVLLSLPDSLHIAFTNTDRNGNYTLKFEESGEALLQVSYMGFVTQRKTLRLERQTQTFDFVLETSAETLKSAVVNARLLGASIRGDTIVYNLGVYTDNTERVLKDILEKLPGIEVDESGRVRAQGQPVKILIDGKEFFFDQSQMATKNLPARMVESVEYIQNYNDIGMLSGASAPQGIAVLNIGIKDEFKGKISGVLTGGGGIIEKYAGKANLFNISKNMSLTALLDANNTGEMAFTLSDYIMFQGGIQQLARNSMGSGNRMSVDGTDVPILAFSDDVARKEGQMPALNLSYRHPNNKLKVNSYLIANRQEQQGETTLRRWATVDSDGVPTSVDGLAERSRFNFINSYLSADYQPAKNFFISNRAMVNGQNRSQNSVVSRQMAMRSDTLLTDAGNRLFDFKNYLLGKYQSKNNNILTFEGFYRYHHRPADRSIESNTPFLGLPFSSPLNTEHRAVQESRQQFHELSFLGAYAYRMGTFYLKSLIGWNYLHHNYNSSLFQLLQGAEVPFTPQHDYANTIRFSNTDLWAGLWLERNVGILRLAMGMDVHRYAGVLSDEQNKPTVKNDQWKLLPNAMVIINLSTANRITASVNLAQESRNITELNESMVATDYKTIFQGKAVDDLFNPVFNASLRYFYANFHSGTTLTFNTSYTRQSNLLARNFTFYPDYTYSAIVESPDNHRIASTLNFRQSLRFLPIDVRLRGTHNLRLNYNYINENENQVVVNTFTADVALMTFTRGMVNGELGGNVNWFHNHSKLLDRTTRLLTLAPYAQLRVKAGKGWTMVSSVQHLKYDANDTRRDMTNLSSSIVYIPPKSKFEFELNANNILNFNKTEKITSIYAGGFFEERIILTLPGFLMAKVTFRI